MEIVPLADRQDLIDELARRHREEWGSFRHKVVEQHGEKLNGRVGQKGIPTTLVALSGDTLLGSVSLVEHDMDNRLDLSPWLAGLFVVPHHRGKGVGTSLVRACVGEAGAQGFGKFYTYTDIHGFYTRLGWSVVEDAEYRGMTVVILKYDLGA